MKKIFIAFLMISGTLDAFSCENLYGLCVGDEVIDRKGNEAKFVGFKNQYDVILSNPRYNNYHYLESLITLYKKEGCDPSNTLCVGEKIINYKGEVGRVVGVSLKRESRVSDTIMVKYSSKIDLEKEFAELLYQVKGCLLSGFCVGDTVITHNAVGKIRSILPARNQIMIKFAGTVSDRIVSPEYLYRTYGCTESHAFCVGDMAVDRWGNKALIRGISSQEKIALQYPNREIHEHWEEDDLYHPEDWPLF